MFSRAIVFTISLALGLTVQATQIFSNHGTLSGWDSTNVEHEGSLQEVTNVYYEPSTALKMTQVYDSSYTGRYHSEVAKEAVYKRGDTGFYGFAFRLQQDWQTSPAQSYNIGQFIADFTDTGCDDWMPSSMVWVLGDQLYSRVKYGTICDQQITTYSNLATIEPGVWYKVEIQASWQTDGTGYYKMWLNGTKVLEKYNIDTTIEDDRPFDFHVGLYANGWHDDKTLKGTQGTRQVWIDEVAAGSTFADADPDQW
ncbi:MAG: hypothetical protein M1821_009488 [Bathelium mastoideum]|nr:MAG: hypothetical protein M1821_009488 [Bathelium mastoideum]